MDEQETVEPGPKLGPKLGPEPQVEIVEPMSKLPAVVEMDCACENSKRIVPLEEANFLGLHWVPTIICLRCGQPVIVKILKGN